MTAGRLLMFGVMALCGMIGWKAGSAGIQEYERTVCDRWETYGGVSVETWASKCPVYTTADLLVMEDLAGPCGTSEISKSPLLLPRSTHRIVTDQELRGRPKFDCRTYRHKKPKTANDKPRFGYITISLTDGPLVATRGWWEPVNSFPILIGLLVFTVSGFCLSLVQGGRSAVEFMEFRLLRFVFDSERYRRVFLQIANNMNEDLERACRAQDWGSRIIIRAYGLCALVSAVLDIAIAQLASAFIGSEKIR